MKYTLETIETTKYNKTNLPASGTTQSAGNRPDYIPSRPGGKGRVDWFPKNAVLQWEFFLNSAAQDDKLREMGLKGRIPVSIAVILTAIIAGPSWYVPSCYGGLVIVQFTAEVTQASDTHNLLQGIVNLGDTITGTYTYDTSAPDMDSDTWEARYEYNAPPSGISVQVGGFESRSDPDSIDFSIEIVNDAHSVGPSYDTFILESENNMPFAAGLVIDSIILDFYDNSCLAITSDALPVDAPEIAMWSRAQVLISGSEPLNPRSGFGITGDLTSAVLIPEPATVLLMGMGCMVLLSRHRRHGNA